MNLTLERSRSRSNATETFGKLTVGKNQYVAVEQPWNDNKKRMSCVPEGTYSVTPTESPKFGASYVLENKALGVYKSNAPEGKRDHILIHPANFAAQLLGCIAPGLSRGKLDRKGVSTNAALQSKKAFAEISKLLGRTEKHTLTITWGP